MRRTLVAVICIAGLLVGYGVADAYDRVPGVLTIDRPVTDQTPEAVEAAPVLPVAGTDAPVPTTEGLAAALEDDATDPALGKRVGVVVRDALTGEELYTHDGDRPITPASTAKLLTAAAVAETADLTRVMSTTVVAGEQPDELVLVASGGLGRGVSPLLRLAALWNVPVACNPSSADFMMSSPWLGQDYEMQIPDANAWISSRSDNN